MPEKLPSNVRMRGDSYQVDLKIDGKRVRKLFTTLEQAKSFLNNPVKLSAKVPIGDGLQAAYDYHWRNSADARTCYLIVKEASKELVSLGCTYVSDVTNAHLMKLVEGFRLKGNKDSTINRKLARLHKAFDYHRDLGNISNAPRIKTFKERATRMRYLTQHEETLVWARLPLEYRNLFDFLISTGCRFSEATRVTWLDISPDKKEVTFWETKNNSSRTIPLMQQAKASVNRMLHNAEGPFTVFKYDRCHEAFRKAVANSGIASPEEVTIHTLRHTSVSRMVQAGVDLMRVKEWHGHTSVNTTMRYAHLAPKDLHRVADMLNTASPQSSKAS